MTTEQENFRSELTKGIIELEQTFGVVVKWGGTEYNALMTPIKYSEKFVTGGFDDVNEFELTFRKLDDDGSEIFASGLPLLGDRISINDIDYRVSGFETDPVDPTFRLLMQSADS